jgi:hypothetical protein
MRRLPKDVPKTDLVKVEETQDDSLKDEETQEKGAVEAIESESWLSKGD